DGLRRAAEGLVLLVAPEGRLVAARPRLRVLVRVAAAVVDRSSLRNRREEERILFVRHLEAIDEVGPGLLDPAVHLARARVGAAEPELALGHPRHLEVFQGERDALLGSGLDRQQALDPQNADLVLSALYSSERRGRPARRLPVEEHVHALDLALHEDAPRRDLMKRG